MSNLGQFRMDLRNFSVKVEKDAVATVKRLALTVDKHLVMNTPVDTGRLRSNWIPTLEAPSTEQKVPYAPGSNPGKKRKTNRGAATQGALTAMVTVMATWELGKQIWIVNNTEYLKYLNDGTTPTRQASPGFVERAIQAGFKEGLKR